MRVLSGEELAAIAQRMFENIEGEIEQIIPESTLEEMDLACRMLLQTIALGCADALRE
jgi:hypothetical protein